MNQEVVGMPIVNDLLKEQSLTRYKLSKISDVPQTTIRDICSGKAELGKCTAETVCKIARALNTTVETLVSYYDRPNFEAFKSNVCHKVKIKGDLDFIIETLESGEIRKLHQKRWCLESLYLLAMVDYLSRENGLPVCLEYNDLRKLKFSETVYPGGVLIKCLAAGNDDAKEESIKDAILEFMRFNIVEGEVRSVC